MRRPSRIVLAALVLVVAAELGLRAVGLHTPVVYEPTPYGYRPRPDQHVTRLGSQVSYNAYGMRSAAAAALPAPGMLRILCLGDSVTNGGAMTDQRETFPFLLERALRGRAIAAEVLNASAPGWSVDNEWGWLRANGTFGASVVILTVSTHDLFQPAAGADYLDRHPSYPSRPPRLALEGLLSYYVVPRLGGEIYDPVAASFRADAASAAERRRTMLSIAERVKGERARLVVLYLDEDDPLATRAAAVEAKRELLEALGAAGASIVGIDEALRRHGRRALYRDAVHPSVEGNRAIAATLAGVLGRELLP